MSLGPRPREQVWRKLLSPDGSFFPPLAERSTTCMESYSAFARRHSEGEVVAVGSRARIALVPIVIDFEARGGALVRDLAEALRAFADPTRVDVLRVSALEGDRSLRLLRARGAARGTLNGAAVLDVLARQAPAEAAIVVAVTELPIAWPAGTGAGAGFAAATTSRRHHRSLLFLDPRSDAASRSALLARHVAAAVIGTQRCEYSRCLLNAAMPHGYPHLCPLCLRKLALAAGADFDPIARYTKLLRLYRGMCTAGSSVEVRWLAERLTEATGRVHDGGIAGDSDGDGAQRWVPPAPEPAMQHPQPRRRSSGPSSVAPVAAAAAAASALAPEAREAREIVERVRLGGKASFGEMQLVERNLHLGLFPLENRGLSFIERRRSALDALCAAAERSAPGNARGGGSGGSGSGGGGSVAARGGENVPAAQQPRAQQQQGPSSELLAVIERVRRGGDASFGELRSIHLCGALPFAILPPKGACIGFKETRQVALDELRRQLGVTDL